MSPDMHNRGHEDVTGPVAQPTSPSILDDVERYYASRLAEHGATPQGVDWNGDESQLLRFRQFLKLLPEDGQVSINDIGCGYGALLPFLHAERGSVDYHGCDISEAMIEAARQLHGDQPAARFAVEDTPSRIADYGFASGIFNVRLDRGDAAGRLGAAHHRRRRGEAVHRRAGAALPRSGAQAWDRDLTAPGPATPAGPVDGSACGLRGAARQLTAAAVNHGDRGDIPPSRLTGRRRPRERKQN